MFFLQDIDEEWESWKSKHNKVYENENEDKNRLKRGAERLLLKIFAYLVESAERSTNPGQAN